MPFFAENLFKKLNDNILSVHLTQFEDFKLPTLNENQNKMADEMLHILEIINLVNKIRSKNGLSMKTPLKEIIIESTNEIINIVNKYSNFILDELNVLSYKTKTFEISNVDITVRPNFSIIKQKYSDIKLIESTIKNLKNEQKRELFCDNTIEIDNITIDPLMCKVLIEPIKLESFYSEYTYANDTNYSVYLNSIIDDEVLALGYAKKIASTYQKMRRDAKLHQWDKIKLAYQGNLEYDIENEKLINVIHTTCGYKTEKISTINEDQIIFKLDLNNDNQNNNTTLYLLNP
jgi:isoleucyl-tRNA synthetase